MTGIRYYSERHDDGSFLVIDVLTGHPASLGGQICCMLKKAEADEIVDYLQRQGSDGQPIVAK